MICECITKKGDRCKKKASLKKDDDARFCYLHQNCDNAIEEENILKLDYLCSPKLNKNIRYEIAKNLDDKDLSRLCKTNKKCAEICNSKDFIRIKFELGEKIHMIWDFLKMSKPENMSFYAWFKILEPEIKNEQFDVAKLFNLSFVYDSTALIDFLLYKTDKIFTPKMNRKLHITDIIDAITQPNAKIDTVKYALHKLDIPVFIIQQSLTRLTTPPYIGNKLDIARFLIDLLELRY